MVATLDEPARTRTLSEGGWSAHTGEIEAPARAPGSRVGDYIVLHRIGAGGMGVVYAAYDPHLDRKIALKVLRGGFEAEDFALARARMIAEGRALARLSHPNVVTVHDVGTIDDEVYIAMELVDGQTLSQWRDEKTRTWQETIAMFGEVAEGLCAVHEAGLVHRDVKPDNVLVDRHGRARVTDFGLARPDHDAPAPPPSLELEERAVLEGVPVNDRAPLTQTGARLGTPAYMAREQLKGNAATAQSDQFAFCVALWECLYGVRPFAGDNWISLVVSVSQGNIDEPPAPPQGRPVPAWLRRILERGLRPEAEERWPSMRELVAAIAAGDPDRAKKRRYAAIGVIAIVGLLAGGVALAEERSRDNALAACNETAAAIDETWNDDARETIESAFASSKAADAAKTGRDVAEAFDAYASAWAEERAELCVAATVERSLDADLAMRSTDCLEQARSSFEAMVRVFGAADDIVVARAQRSAEGLADLERCRDERHLQSMPPLPEDPQAQAEVRDVFEELARTQVDEHTGSYDQGLVLSRAALKRALATEHLPLIATAHYRVALFLEKKGEYDEAVDAWVASFHDAALGGHDQLAAEAASALAFCEGYQLARHDAGIRWAELAGVYLEKLGLQHTLTEATRLDVLAVLLEQKDRYAESIATHERALALRREIVGPDHHSIAYGMANLAGVLQNTDDLERARELLIESKRIFEASFGPENPTTAHVLHNLGNLERELGHFEESEVLLQRALAIWTKNLGPDHPDVGDVYNALGDLRRAQARLDEAAAMHEKALAIHERSLAKDHPTVRRTAERLGEIFVAQGRLDEAQANL